MKAVGIIILTIIVFFFGYMMYDNEDIQNAEISGIDVKRLKTITETIECYTETSDFTCGQISFTTNSDQILEETEIITIVEEKEVEVIDDNGIITIETQNVASLPTPPLDTVGVNPASFDNKIMAQNATGLTASEQAFLDDEEKAMRLNQRGMTT